MRRATAFFREFEAADQQQADASSRRWFAAAAIYNFAWGAVTLSMPWLFFEMAGMEAPNYFVLWQCIGMFVLVYAPGYWWAAHDPFRFRHFILIGFVGKVLGPVGFLWFAAQGALPVAFGWTILTNDLIWLPAFYSFLKRAAERSGGWVQMARGG
jgi:small multidrug resistance pump